MTELPERIASPSRRYTDKEVARIIKDASELQQVETAPESASVGLSLAELESVAREAGLDPALVRRAAANLDTRVSDVKPSRFFGAPRTLVLERTIDGEVPVDEYEMLALTIQRTLGGLGTASTFGRTMQWTTAPSGRRRGSMRVVQVTITPRNGVTTIRIEEPLQQVAIALFVGSMGGVGMGLMPLIGVGAGTLGASAIGPGGAVAFAVAGVATFIGGLYGAARFAFGRIVRARSEKLHGLMSELVGQVSSTAVKKEGGQR